MSSVVQVRELAARVWRGELSHSRASFAGLNGDAVVRTRLAALWMRARRESPELRILEAVDPLSGDPSQILETTERAVDQVLPTYYPTWMSLLDGMKAQAWPVVDLLLLQSLAARQGRWVVRELELADARTARDLVAAPSLATPEHVTALAEAARRAYQEGRPDEAVSMLRELDALERTPVTLLQLSVALWRSGRPVHGLHAIRACLLEGPSAFPSPDVLLSAARVESSLRRVVEQVAVMGPHEEPAVAAISAFVQDRRSRPSWGVEGPHLP